MNISRFAIFAILVVACSATSRLTATNSDDPRDAGPQGLASGTVDASAARGSEPQPDAAIDPGLPDDLADAATTDGAKPAETSPVVSLEVIPLTERATASPYGDPIRFYAWATRLDGTRSDVSSEATWTSSSSQIAYFFLPAVAMPLSPGMVTPGQQPLVTSVAAGKTTITATVGTMTATAGITAFN